MDKTIHLSSDDSLVVEEVKPAKVVPNKIKKVGGKKLDDTIELISSDEDDYENQTGRFKTGPWLPTEKILYHL